jgi:hypothetical protein
MKVTELVYGYTKNMGNYESEKIEVRTQLDENEKPLEVLSEMKEFVKNGTDFSPKTEKLAEEKAVENKTEKPLEPQVSDEKPKAPKKTKAKKTTEEEAPAEEKAEEEAKAPAKEEEKTKKFREKSTPYDRTNELHKKFFGQILDGLVPGWRQDKGEKKAKCVKISQELNGQAFLDSEGLVLPEFKAKMTEMV